MKKFTRQLIPLLLLVIILALSRIVPHVPNVAPIAAMSLFVGAHMNWRFAVIIPLIAMFLADYFIGFHTTMIFVYGSFLLIAGVGILLKNYKTPFTIFVASAVSSLLFFGLSNFGVFIAGDLYPRTWVGLSECYLAALPFFRNTILGDLIYTGVFFGGYELIRQIYLEKRINKTG